MTLVIKIPIMSLYKPNTIVKPRRRIINKIEPRFVQQPIATVDVRESLRCLLDAVDTITNETQQYCCIKDCERKLTDNRTTNSLHGVYEYKHGFIERNWKNICRHHYGIDYNKYKK